MVDRKEGLPLIVWQLSQCTTQGEMQSVIGVGGGSYTNENAQDAVGGMVDSSLVYVDATPLLTRAALTGDVTASQGSNATTIAAGAITLAKMADVSTGTIFYRKTAGTGSPEVQTLSTLKTDLGLTGTNSGDQTSIVGITGTKSQFDTAVTDGNFLYVGDVTQYTDEMAQDAIGAILTDSATVDFTYNDGANTITAAVIPNTSTQRVEIVKNSGAVVGTRKQLNFIEGANVTLTIADDAGNDQVDITVAASGGGVTDGDKGDITVSGSGATWTIDPAAVTYAKIQNVSATSRFLGRITGGAGSAEELTGTQATTLLDNFTSGLKGVVPASGGGTSNFLRADGTWAAPPGGGGGGSGTAIVDFGAFPGASDASVAVTGQAGIVSGSIVEAWIRPEATADHTADEHMLESIKVFAGNIVAGTGFTIYAFNGSEINEPFAPIKGLTGTLAGQLSSPPTYLLPTQGGRGTRLYGQFTVAWRWA